MIVETERRDSKSCRGTAGATGKEEGRKKQKKKKERNGVGRKTRKQHTRKGGQQSSQNIYHWMDG